MNGHECDKNPIPGSFVLTCDHVESILLVLFRPLREEPFRRDDGKAFSVLPLVMQET